MLAHCVAAGSIAIVIAFQFFVGWRAIRERWEETECSLSLASPRAAVGDSSIYINGWRKHQVWYGNIIASHVAPLEDYWGCQTWRDNPHVSGGSVKWADREIGGKITSLKRARGKAWFGGVVFARWGKNGHSSVMEHELYLNVLCRSFPGIDYFPFQVPDGNRPLQMFKIVFNRTTFWNLAHLEPACIACNLLEATQGRCSCSRALTLASTLRCATFCDKSMERASQLILPIALRICSVDFSPVSFASARVPFITAS